MNWQAAKLGSVFENTYFSFFFQISEKHDFLRFYRAMLAQSAVMRQ